MKKLTILAGVVLLLAVSGFAEEQGNRRLITVTGTSEVKVVPDEVTVSLGVETSDIDLVNAKNENDDRIKKLLDVALNYKISQKDIQTSQINIEPTYTYPSSGKGKKFAGYSVSNYVVVTLKDLKKFDDFLKDIIDVGANSVRGITFRSSEIRAYKAEAETLAVEAAKEKADALAKELGQQVGKPYAITENFQGPRPMQDAIGLGSEWNAEAAKKSAESDSNIAPGQIVVSQSVTVSFELK